MTAGSSVEVCACRLEVDIDDLVTRYKTKGVLLELLPSGSKLSSSFINTSDFYVQIGLSSDKQIY